MFKTNEYNNSVKVSAYRRQRHRAEKLRKLPEQVDGFRTEKEVHVDETRLGDPVGVYLRHVRLTLEPVQKAAEEALEKVQIKVTRRRHVSIVTLSANEDLTSIHVSDGFSHMTPIDRSSLSG